MSQAGTDGHRGQARGDIEVERYEAKYIIPPRLVPEIRRFIRPFCCPDPHARGFPPEYCITTLQLDSPSLSLHHAKEDEALHRFKLRVRRYDMEPDGLVFLEVKVKNGRTIMKRRAGVPASLWCEDLACGRQQPPRFGSDHEELAFVEFTRLVRQIGARPVVIVRYVRESHIGVLDSYVRVTFDRKLEYHPATSWDSWGTDGRWRSMDSGQAQDHDLPFSGIVLELKVLSHVPRWIVDLVQEFDLVRVGNCKYSTAIWAESLSRGMPLAPAYAADLVTM